MNLKPSAVLTEQEVQRGLKMVIGDGLATEVMTTLTGSVFLTAMALLMGANNVEIGVLAALPTVTNIFQLVSIWLVRRYNNRRAVSVVCSFLARIPVAVMAILLLVFPASRSMNLLIVFLFFYYLFGSIAGLSWNAWMKDLVPDNILGAYFSRRSSYTQTLNASLSVVLAVVVDFVKSRYPQYELTTYYTMFLGAGIAGIIGAFVLAKAPEPQSVMVKENIFKLFRRPLRDGNFRRLLIFNSAWVFALNIATPFFTVFMMKTLGLPILYIIGLGILSQLAGIFTVRVWGRSSDKYSNKTVIAICAPLYIFCIIAWCFAGIYTHFISNLLLLAAIHIVTGISTAGINLALINIGLKLAPREQSIVYLSAKNIITAVFSSIAPVIGGILADYFNKRHLIIDARWSGPKVDKLFHLLSLHQWNFLFLIGALLALVSLELLVQVKETGEVEKNIVVRMMRSNIKNNLKDYFLIGNLIDLHENLRAVIKGRKSAPQVKEAADTTRET